MKSISAGLLMLVLAVCWVAGCSETKPSGTYQCLGDDLAEETAQVIYQTDFSDAASLAGWVMEGPGVARIEDGWMVMESPDIENHIVHWLDRELPDSFVAEYDFQVLSEDGLCIIFVAATGKEGQSIFAEGIAERNGQFTQYTKGDINNYLIIYHSQNPTHLEYTDNELRKDAGFELLQKSPTAIPRGSEKVHHIKVVKDADHIMMSVDGKAIVDHVDDGTILGPAYGKGWLGLRQMKWTKARYDNLVIRPLQP